VAAQLKNLLRKYWLRWNVQRARAGDRAAMSRLYLVGDPWHLNSPAERLRFEETARFIREKLSSHFSSILEIGCGEGLQTEYLAPLTDRIVGVDPSSHAIKRASAKNICNASFAVGDLDSYADSCKEQFEVVTACEILYYLPDVKEACAKLSALGRTCLVTYYQGAFDQLDEHFNRMNVSSGFIHGPNCKWKIVYWARP
jgi:2-polyprenyl-3-methyl-5-hydroxy-6-metoxy-1,4-benzoquinol methylase